MTAYEDLKARGRAIAIRRIHELPTGKLVRDTDLADLIYEQIPTAIDEDIVESGICTPAWVAQLLADKPDLFNVKPMELMPSDPTFGGMFRTMITKFVIIDLEIELVEECRTRGLVTDELVDDWMPAMKRSKELFAHNHIRTPYRGEPDGSARRL